MSWRGKHGQQARPTEGQQRGMLVSSIAGTKTQRLLVTGNCNSGTLKRLKHPCHVMSTTVCAPSTRTCFP